MRETIDLATRMQTWLVAQLPETMIGFVSAVITLVLVVILYKVTSGIILRAMRRQQRPDAQIKLTEINVRVSYESSYDLAMQTLADCARRVTADVIAETGREPVVRSEFFDSGVMMRLRYQTIASDRERIATEIVGAVVNAFGTSEKLGFAYPHSAVEYRAADGKSLPPMFKEVTVD